MQRNEENVTDGGKQLKRKNIYHGLFLDNTF